jgi:hypothetical protein
LAAVSLGNSFIFIALSLGIGFSTHLAETDGLIMLREEEGYFIMDYFMHDFRFHFISDYILFKPLISGSMNCGRNGKALS